MGKYSPRYQVMNSKEVKVFHKKLEGQFGFKGRLDCLFFEKKDKIYIISKGYRDLDVKKFNINSMGLYIAKEDLGGVRLSVEGSQLVGPKSSKNIVEVLDPKEWMCGNDILVKEKLKNFVLVKYKKDFLGCGFFKKGKLLNYIPKSRRMKE